MSAYTTCRKMSPSIRSGEGKGRRVQIARLWRASWTLRPQYDAVFAHMNPEYVLYGGLFWRLLRKRIGLWYTHGTVSTALKTATLLTHHVFTASPESFRIDSPKKVVTGHGIDMALFEGEPLDKTPDTISILTVGRIAKTKNIHLLLEALAHLRTTHDARLTVVGGPTTVREKDYARTLTEKLDELDIKDYVQFVGAQSQAQIAPHYHAADVFVNVSDTGSLDKVVLEAFLTRTPVVSSNVAFKDILAPHGLFLESTAPADIADAILRAQEFTRTSELYEYTATRHSLPMLIENILHRYRHSV